MSRYGGRYGGDRYGSSSRRQDDSGTKVYVGNLAPGADKGEVARAFSHYGPLRNVWIARNPPGFAFVEFEDPRDAEDAVRGLDGNKVISGSRVRVELSANRPRRGTYGGPPARSGFNPDDRCYECGERGHYAYDCRRRRQRMSRSRSRSTSRYGSRRRSRSRSRSRGRRTRSPSPRRSRSARRSRSSARRSGSSPRRSASPPRRSRSSRRSRSRSAARPRSRSVSRSRGKSAESR